MPPPQESKSLNYDELYALPYQLPNSYTRFSSTVEDEIKGATYDMTEEDDVFLKSFNGKRPPAQQLSEDDFEKIMESFEETASYLTPFAAVDKSIAPYSDMVPGLNNLDCACKGLPHAKELYEYWKQRRQACNGPLHPPLKFETHQDTDDMDPYVCFRRREVRQTRKTRARDVQSADKLKRLRRELEEGRNLVLESYQREVDKRELLQLEKSVYETRASLKELKVRLGIKSNDSDLLPVKVSREEGPHRPAMIADAMFQEEPTVKRKAPDASSAQRAAAAGASASTSAGAGAMRLGQPRPSHAQAVEMDLPQLDSMKAARDEELRKDIVNKIQNHHNWNRNHVDLTKGPLPPVRSPSRQPSFRAAQAQYLLTPPASSASQEESMEEPTPMDLDETVPSAVYQFQGAPLYDDDPPRIAFRRRIGRLNRLWIDRRTLGKTPPRDDHGESDRWKYDQDDSEDERPSYEVDPYDAHCIKFRATIPLTRDARGPPQRPPALIQGQMGPQQGAIAQALASGQWHPPWSGRPTPSAQSQEG